MFDENALALLVNVMGEDRVMLGSDYPFPLGELCVGSLINDSNAFSPETKSRLSGGNAVEFFKAVRQLQEALNKPILDLSEHAKQKLSKSMTDRH